MDCYEFVMIHRFFEERHLIARKHDDKEYIKNLRPPSWHSGGAVPRNVLYKEENKKLMCFDLIPAVDLFHAAVDRKQYLVKTKFRENIGRYLIPKILRGCASRGVVQSYAPGIMLLYLEHCEGCTWQDLIPLLMEQQKQLIDANQYATTEHWSEDMFGKVNEYYKEWCTNKILGKKKRVAILTDLMA